MDWRPAFSLGLFLIGSGIAFGAADWTATESRPNALGERKTVVRDMSGRTVGTIVARPANALGEVRA
jgi:hypothetical protein